MAARASDRDVGRNIKALRRRKGLSQAQLAGTRFTSAYVSLIESGKRSPSRSALRHFADTLAVTEEDLMRARRPDLELELDLEIQEAKALLYGGDRAEAIDR
ncbi:MAG: helix-turn-helix domain-containing protein, partial [Actinomycetota bacterium]|nr:helix-turn-helix domain-containing protein [Actinomycetota bacterium]